MEPTDAVRQPQINMARSTVMTDTQEQDTNTIPHQTPEELSEQDMQAVNGGGKVGNPQKLLEYVRGPFSPSSSFGIGRMEEHVPVASPEHPVPAATREKKGWSQASKAEAAAIGTGSATSFTVGLGAGAIENKL